MSKSTRQNIVQGLIAFLVAFALSAVMLFYRHDPVLFAFLISAGMGIFSGGVANAIFNLRDRSQSKTTGILMSVGIMLLIAGAAFGLYLEWPYL